MGFFIPAVLASVAGWFADEKLNDGRVTDWALGKADQAVEAGAGYVGGKTLGAVGIDGDTGNDIKQFFGDHWGKMIAGSAGIWGVSKLPKPMRNIIFAAAALTVLVFTANHLASKNLQNEFTNAGSNDDKRDRTLARVPSKDDPNFAVQSTSIGQTDLNLTPAPE